MAVLWKAVTLDGSMSRLVLDASTSSLWYWLKLVNHSFWLTRARSGLNPNGKRKSLNELISHKATFRAAYI